MKRWLDSILNACRSNTSDVRQIPQTSDVLFSRAQIYESAKIEVNLTEQLFKEKLSTLAKGHMTIVRLSKLISLKF